MRIRIEYSVIGRVRFISHLDLMRAFFRACMRGQIPVALSEGFSPHLKLSFGPPLGVGTASNCEFVDASLKSEMEPERIKTLLQEGLPEGIVVNRVYSVSESLPSIVSQSREAVYIVEVPIDKLNDLSPRIEKFLNSKDVIVKRYKAKKEKTINIRPFVKALEKKENTLRMQVLVGDGGSAKPLEILKRLFCDVEENELMLWCVTRDRLIMQEK